MTQDLTKKCQKALRKNINECPHIIRKDEKFKFKSISTHNQMFDKNT